MASPAIVNINSWIRTFERTLKLVFLIESLQKIRMSYHVIVGDLYLESIQNRPGIELINTAKVARTSC